MSTSLHGPSETSSQRSTSLDDIPCRDNPAEMQTFPQVHRQPIDLCDHGLTYSNHVLSAAEFQHQHLRYRRLYPLLPAADPSRPRVPSRRCRMNMDVIVDLEGILPEGIQDLRTGQPLVNLDSIHIFTFYSDSQLHNINVDYTKKAIQDLCWECCRLTIRKRDFKLWLQVIPPHSPSFPYGLYEPLDYDNLWIEVLNVHYIPLGQDRVHLRAHHPEGIFD